MPGPSQSIPRVDVFLLEEPLLCFLQGKAFASHFAKIEHQCRTSVSF